MPEPSSSMMIREVGVVSKSGEKFSNVMRTQEASAS